MPETGLDSWMLAGSKQWCKKRLTTTICWFLPLGFGLHSGLAKCIQTDSFSLQENKSLKPYRGMFNVQLVYRFQSGKSNISKKRNTIETEGRINGAMTDF